MRPPVRPGALDTALSDFAAKSGGDHRVRMRVTRVDGTVVEGSLLEVTPEKVVMLGAAQLQPTEINVGDVGSIDVRAPHRGREWTLAAVAIVGATGVMVGLGRLPWIDLRKDSLSPFMFLYIAAAGLFPVVLARTRLGRWLTRWQTLYPRETPE